MGSGPQTPCSLFKEEHHPILDDDHQETHVRTSSRILPSDGAWQRLSFLHGSRTSGPERRQRACTSISVGLHVSLNLCTGQCDFLPLTGENHQCHHRQQARAWRKGPPLVLSVREEPATQWRSVPSLQLYFWDSKLGLIISKEWQWCTMSSCPEGSQQSWEQWKAYSLVEFSWRQETAAKDPGPSSKGIGRARKKLAKTNALR